ncbi:pol polyprotein [Tanacetum coccineum]
MLPHLRARAQWGRVQKMEFLGQNGFEASELVRPADTNAAPKVRLMTNETNVTAPVNVTGAPVTNTVANHAEKLEKFNRHNFKRWQQKMFFYLNTLNLARFLNETAPQVEPPAEGQPSNAQAVQAVEAWRHSDFLCHDYVLNGLVDSLYNVYCRITTVKEFWESLESKYKTEDAGTKKFVVARFLDYKMDDSKIVITQVSKICGCLPKHIHAEGMNLSETFQVAAIIKKLPPSWVEFKNYLKHKRKEMSVKDLVVRLRIEEDNKLAQKNTYTPDSAKANMVEHVGSSSKSNSKAKGKGKKKNDKKNKGKAEYFAPKAGIMKQKFQGTCYNCDQPGHRAANCKMSKRVNPRQANMVNDNVDMIAMVSDVIAMISKVNLVAVDNGEKLYTGNSATADIKGEGDVILKMTFEKELKLTNVFYVSEIRKNLVSGWLLNKFGFCLVFESDKFVLSKIKCSCKRICRECKDESIDKFVLYKTEVENQIGRKIKVVRSDRGGEYVSPFVEICVKHGIRHEFTAPYSPQQNAKVVVPTPKAQKIRPKSVDCIFIGYAKNSSAYRFIVHDSKNPDIQKNAVMESRNASFFENIFPCLTKETESSLRLDDEVVQDKRQRDDNDLHDERQDQLEEEEVDPRRSKKARTEKSFGLDFVSFMVENEPTSYREAVTSTEGHQWKEAIKSEIDSILQNHMWELMDLPPGCKPLGYKWIFKKKMKADGTIDKYKARLVIKGYRQREGLDYFDTYSPVT